MSMRPYLKSVKRLVRDERGNTLIIAAFSLVPLLGILGGAVDTTRLYLVKSRLQQACDAAVLGGRVAMGNQKWSDASKATADRYFTSNFNAGRYGTVDSKIDYVVNDNLIVHGIAAVSVQMAIMQIFGFGTVSLKSECDAKLELPNADIMFVLDTTLSMSEINSGDSVSRLKALQDAVKLFYSSIENTKGVDTRVRYGFVPYSTTVNVGTLLKPEWLVDRWTYQSRQPDGTEQVPYTQGGTVRSFTDWAYASGSRSERKYTISPESCAAPVGSKKSDIVVSFQHSGGIVVSKFFNHFVRSILWRFALLSLCRGAAFSYRRHTIAGSRRFPAAENKPCNRGHSEFSTHSHPHPQAQRHLVILPPV